MRSIGEMNDAKRDRSNPLLPLRHRKLNREIHLHHNKVGETIKQQTLETIGLILAIVGSSITTIGILVNNGLLDHISAMQIWAISNTIFVIYFYGRYKDMWDGNLGDGIMCGTYTVALVSGIWGLLHV